MKRLLVISPHFPPVNAPDLHRVRMSLPHWVEAGWRVTILAAEPEESSQANEPELLETIPSEVEVIRLKPLNRQSTMRLGLGNLGWRLLPALLREARKQLTAGSVDLVYFSTTQFACLPIGRIWQKLYGVPYVIDLQDPWVNDYYSQTQTRPPGGWKFHFSQLFARTMEGWTLRRCAGLISVSPTYLETLRQRYTWFVRIPQRVLPFGFSRRDLERAREFPPSAPPVKNHLRLVYTGRLGSDMMRPFRFLLAGIQKVQRTDSARRIEADFIGASYSPTPEQDQPIEALPEGIRFHPRRIGFIESLRRQAVGEVLLIFGSDDPGYSPSKIYFLLAQNKPILALVDEGTVLARHLADWPQVCRITPCDHPTNFLSLELFFKNPQSLPTNKEAQERLNQWEARQLAEAQLIFFREVLSP